jgi:alpha-mannosidase
MHPDAVFLVPHTHWDREWYEPFQRFRLRLVDLLDDVVPRALADPGFRFTLDGQMAVVDDYLEVRPEAAEAIARLVRRGQFAVGPWAILLDEFLCSGENIVRNLEWGLARAAAFGGAMQVGYLPDMFGHCAQMPQVLAAAGIRQACVWRGVPAAVTHHAFVWRAPDGTGIRTEYLAGGYSNAAGMLADPDRLDAAVASHVERMRPWYGADPILAMYGTDHSAPLPWLSSAVSAFGDAERLRMSTLDEYLGRFDPADVDGLPVWQGEMRSHARANILPGVLSSRVHLKRALSAAERMVERYAEPLAALWTAPERWPGRLLELAWQRLIQSSCHDSVTGCGVDETAVQVDARIAEAEQIGRGIRDKVLGALAAAAPADAVVVVNPSPHPRADPVRVQLPAASAASSSDGVALRLPSGVEVPVEQTASGTGWASVPVPPLGWVAARVVPGDVAPSTGAVSAVERGLANEHLTVTVAGDGTLTLEVAGGATLRGVGRIVDGGDVGDLYNYAPPDDDRPVDTPESVTLRTIDGGPLVGRLEIDRRYPWGAVTTGVELRAGVRFCRLDVVFDNRRTDHRVRMHVPLARPADSSHAEGQFAVTTRGLSGEGGHGEVPLPTYPAYGFVDAGGVAVLLDQVTEYELVAGGTELALTLLRATGVISRRDHPLRAEPAGPVIATPQAQCLGPGRASLAVLPHAGDWAAAGVLAAAEEFRCPLVSVPGRGAAGESAGSGTGLTVSGDRVVMSSLRRRDADRLEVRLVAMGGEPTTALVTPVAAARRVDLLGRPRTDLSADLSPLDGTLTLPLRGGEIATLQVTLPTGGRT